LEEPLDIERNLDKGRACPYDVHDFNLFLPGGDGLLENVRSDEEDGDEK
jgi:hypothetical protein